MRVVQEKAAKSKDAGLPSVSASVLLQLFPFGVLLDKNMKVISAGEKVIGAWGGPKESFLGQPVTDLFRVRRPKGAPFDFNSVSKQ